tara:strand:- start:145 stop:3210 length:3066 start_codon:yes stop_codon:yes gene_type:complete
MSETQMSETQMSENQTFFLEMGFASQTVIEAMSRFPALRDHQEMLNWLLQQSNVGQIPKKLKLDISDTRTLTYYGSKVKYNGMPGSIDGFDITHSVVRFNPVSQIATRKWLHVSDSELEWVIIHHNSIPMNAAIATAWRRQVGVVSIPIGSVLSAITDYEESGADTTFWDEVDTVTRLHTVLTMWLKYGGTTDTHQPLWSAIDGFTSRHAHPPSGGTSPRFSPVGTKTIPTSRKHYSMDRCRHELRIELMSYFLTLCDFYAIPMQKFTEHMVLCNTQNDFLNMIITLFPADFDPRKGLYLRNNYTFLEMLIIWLDPTLYLKMEVKKYHSKCIPLVDFEMQPFDHRVPETTVKIKVFFNDMTFVMPYQNKATVRRHFQALFRRMYGYGGSPTPVSINAIYWNETLEKSKKNCLNQTQLSDVLVSRLLPFQQKVVNWMQMRETTGSPLSSMGWKRHQLKDGFTFHTDHFGSLSYSRPSDRIRGGVLAQPSGFGKTVEMLALIASSECVKPTLVIMHPRTLKVWVKEAAKHVPSLRVRKYHGSKRNLNNVQDEVNIVLTSFRIVKNDMVGIRNNQDLQQVDWGRIIIDGFGAVIDEFRYDSPLRNLNADLKWCMGCPYRSGFGSVVALFRFFNMSPLSEVDREFKTTNGVIIQKMLIEMTSSLTLADVTDELPKPVEDITLYQENRYAVSYQHLINAIQRNMYDTSRIIRLGWWMRMAAVHPSLVSLEAFAEKDMENQGHSSTKTSVGDFLESLEESSRKLALQDVVEACIDGKEQCTICMGEIERPTMTSCHHVFCYNCIQSCYEHDQNQRKCPLCRQSGVGSTLLELTNGENNGKVVEDLFFRLVEEGRNYKIEKNIYDEIILERANVGCNKMDYILQKMATSDKTVIYTTSWKEITYIIGVLMRQNVLAGHGLSFTSITRFMNRKQKDKNMAAFQDHRSFIVMEVDPTDTQTVLDTADNIVFFQPCKNENDRQIALNRVIRIGGEKPVNVVTLRTKGTIEDTSVNDMFDGLQVIGRHIGAY